MFGPLFGFELRSHFRRPVTWLYVAIVFFMAFSAVSTESCVSGQMLGKVKKNSPYSLAQLYGILLAIGQIMTIALVGTTVLRDYDAGVHEILFSTRISRAAYLGAKYLGALLAMLVAVRHPPRERAGLAGVDQRAAQRDGVAGRTGAGQGGIGGLQAEGKGVDRRAGDAVGAGGGGPAAGADIA